MNLILFYFIVIYPTNHVYYTVIKQIPVFCLGLLHNCNGYSIRPLPKLQSQKKKPKHKKTNKPKQNCTENHLLHFLPCFNNSIKKEIEMTIQLIKNGSSVHDHHCRQNKATIVFHLLNRKSYLFRVGSHEVWYICSLLLHHHPTQNHLLISEGFILRYLQ